MKVTICQGGAETKQTILDGNHFIPQLQRLWDEVQVSLTYSSRGRPPSESISFVPDASFKVSVDRFQFGLWQNGYEFFTGRADDLKFDIVPRAILQLDLLNRPATIGECVNVVIQRDGSLIFWGDIGFGLLDERLKKLREDGSSVWIDSNEFIGSDNISFEANEDDGCVYICCDRTDCAPMVTPRYLGIIVTPPRAFDVIDYDLDNNPIFKIIQAFHMIDKEKDPSLSNHVFRRSFVLARFAIFSSECLKCCRNYYGEGADLIFGPIIKLLSTRLPVNALGLNPLSGAELSAERKRICQDAQVIDFHNVHLEDVDFPDYLKRSNVRYEISGGLQNTFISYFNMWRVEAPLGSLLWTPVLNHLWLPDENGMMGILYSTVELPLRHLPGCIRKFRADYALIAHGLYPLVIGEYAASSGPRFDPKDWVLAAIEAEMYLENVIGIHRDPLYKEFLLNLCCFPMYFTADEVQITIMRPLFDENMKLKGHAFTTDPRFKFRLLSMEGEADSDITPELLANGLDLLNSFDGSTQHAADHMEDVLGRISTLDFGQQFPPHRRRTCPERIDLGKVNINTLRLLRALGIFLHCHAKNLLMLRDRAGPAVRPQRPYALPMALQNSPYAKSMDRDTPANMRVRTSAAVPSPWTPKGQISTGVLIEMLKDTPYYYHLCPVKKQTSDLVFTSKSDTSNCPRRAVFFLRGGDMTTEGYFLKHVGCKPRIADVIPLAVFHMSVPSHDCYLLGLESLVPFEDEIGRNALWFSDITWDLARIIIDILAAIKTLAKAGWAHGNICPNNIMWSAGTRMWKLTSLTAIRPLKAKTELAQIGTYMFVDPLVRHGAPKSVKTEMYSLGCSLLHITDKWAAPKMLADRSIGQMYVDDLKPFREFAEFLKGHPSINEALQRARELGVKELGQGGWRFKRLDKLLLPKGPVTPEKSSSSTSPTSSPPFGEVTPMAPRAKEAVETTASPVHPNIRPFIV